MGGNCSEVCWTRTGLGGLWAEYKEKDKMMEEQIAYGNGAGSYKYSEAQKLILGTSLTAKTR